MSADEPCAYARLRHSVSSALSSEANTKRIALVESCFGSAGQPLSVPGRVLVGEGVLTKACRKKLKPRQFFLFNDLLVYGNIIINKKKYNKQHIIPLEEIELQPLEDEGQYRNGWLIRTTVKSFAVYAATSAEKQQWMGHIEMCLRDLLSDSGKMSPRQHAAVWVPDTEVNNCMMKGCKAQFSLVNRRHHCRKCGAVVCKACSSQKALLPRQASKPLRVCTTCFEKLVSERNDPSSPPVEGQPEITRRPGSNESFSPPPRPPLPKIFGAEDDPSKPVDLPPLPSDADESEFVIPKRNPKLYELVNVGNESSFWWDSVDADELQTACRLDSVDKPPEEGFSGISASTESRDTSGEDDSDDDVNGDVDRDRERIRNNFTKHKSVSAKDVEHTN